MSRISRKEMKKDELVLEVSKAVELVQSNKRDLILWGSIAVVLVVAVVGGYFFYTNRVDTASEELGNAMRLYHAPIRPISLNDAGDEPTFPTVQGRDEEALKGFETVANKYSMMRAGKIARYYVGIVQLDQGNVPEAEKQLTAAVSGGDSYVEPLARLALGSVYMREKKLDQAEQAYRYLVDHPTDSVPKITAQLALASLIAPTKPAEADKIFKEIQASKPDPEVANLVSKAQQESGK